jgi:hypothetical protein
MANDDRDRDQQQTEPQQRQDGELKSSKLQVCFSYPQGLNQVSEAVVPGCAVWGGTCLPGWTGLVDLIEAHPLHA